MQFSKFFSTYGGKLAILSVFGLVMFFGLSDITFAANSALTNAGITKGTIEGNTSGLFKDLQKIVYLIMGIGGLWAVAWLVIGGILLAGSGSNPQKRSGGLAAIATACVGIYIIYKAYDIAGWAAAIG